MYPDTIDIDIDLRLGYPDIAAIRPDVIYCQAHGFPSDSPQADAPVFDDIIQAVLAEAGLTEEQITRLAEAGVLTGDRADPGRRAPAG